MKTKHGDVVIRAVHKNRATIDLGFEIDTKKLQMLRNVSAGVEGAEGVQLANLRSMSSITLVIDEQYTSTAHAIATAFVERLAEALEHMQYSEFSDDKGGAVHSETRIK